MGTRGSRWGSQAPVARTIWSALSVPRTVWTAGLGPAATAVTSVPS